MRNDVSRSDAAAFVSEKGGDGFSFARIADAQLRWASPASSAMTSLARLAAARTHADALAATASLRGVLALGAPGAAAIATAAWPERRRAYPHAPAAHAGRRAALGRVGWRADGSDAPHTERAFRGGARARRGYDTGRGRAGDSRRLRRPGVGVAPRARAIGEERRRGDAPPRGSARRARGRRRRGVGGVRRGGGGGGASCRADAGRRDGDGGGGGVRRRRPRRRRPRGGFGGGGDGVRRAAVRHRPRGRHHLAPGVRAEHGVRRARRRRRAPTSCARACALAAASRPVAALARFGGADVVAADLASRAVEPLLTFVCAARLGATTQVTTNLTTTNAKPVKSVSSYSVDYEGVTPMGGGALVDAGCAALEAIAAAAPAEAWSRAWAERGAPGSGSRVRARPRRRQARARVAPAGAGGVAGRARHAPMLQKAWPESRRRRGEDRRWTLRRLPRRARRRLRF